jgi:hypothetical protein
MDQVARLERGAVAPDKFDYRFLRFESGKAGQAALERLTRSDNVDIAARAKAAEANENRYDFEEITPDGPRARTEPRAADIRIRANPAGADLPPSFIQQYGHLDLLDDCREGSVCEARMVDMDRDGVDEVLVAARKAISVFKLEADGRWFEWAIYRAPHCQEGEAAIRRALREGRYETAPPRFPDLLIEGVRLRREEGVPECASENHESPAPVVEPAGVDGEQHGRIRPSTIPR